MTITLSLSDGRYQLEHDAETGNYFAVNYDLGVVAEGRTDTEAIANFRKAAAGLVSYCLENGLPLPRELAANKHVAWA